MFYKILASFLLLVGFSSAAYAQEIAVDSGCDNPGVAMPGSGWAVTGSKCVGTNVRAMRMLMWMSPQIKEGHRYQISGDISGVTGTGELRAFSGVSMLPPAPGSWKSVTGLTRYPDRFLWGMGHGIEAGGDNLSIPPFSLTGPGNSVEDIGSWRIFCGPGPMGVFDPILNPGVPGANHTHMFVGNTMPDRENSTYMSLRTKGASTCQSMIGNDAKYPINASGYWMPSIITELNGKLYYLRTNGVLIYYKGVPVPSPTIDYSGVTPYGGIISANGTTTVTRTSGALHTTYTVGQTLYVGNTPYTVASITDANHLVLSGTVATGTGLQLDVITRQLKDDVAVACNERWGRGDGGFGTGLRLDGGVASLTVDQTGAAVTDTTRCPWIPPQMRFITGYNKTNGQGRTDRPIDIATGDAGTGTVSSGSQGAFDYSIWAGPDAYPASAAPLSPNFSTLVDVMNWAAANPTLVHPGNVLHVTTSGPTCWDGHNVDSPDHRSHIAWGVNTTAHVGNARCPVNIPYPIVQMSIQWFYTLDAAFFAGKWRLSIDEMVDGLPAGAGLHTDYMEGQSPTMADKAANNCEQVHNSCTQELGDGTKITTPQNWDGKGPFCNACMKHRPDRYIPINDFGISSNLPTSGHFSVVVTAPGNGQWGFMGLKDWNGSIDNISIIELPQGGSGMAANDSPPPAANDNQEVALGGLSLATGGVR